MNPQLPGSDLVGRGLNDLQQGIQSNEALLIHIAAPDLRFAGVTLSDHPPLPQDPELILDANLSLTDGDGAHYAYNALLRRVDIFCKTALVV